MPWICEEHNLHYDGRGQEEMPAGHFEMLHTAKECPYCRIAELELRLERFLIYLAKPIQ